METTVSPLLQTLERGDVENLCYVLRLYLLVDTCECEGKPCTETCEGCMFCMGVAALTRIGEEAFPDD